ncbi:hypothetical protein D3C80_2162320 [compost metagenome]
MPAMPMAGTNAPMVVGMRQTSSATSTMGDGVAFASDAKGARAMVTTRNTMVSETSRT